MYAIRSYYERVLRKIAELDSVITIAKKEGVDTQKEKMAIRVAEMALKFAKADEIPANLAKNKECYAMHIDFKNNPQKAAEALPDFERESAIVVFVITSYSIHYTKLYESFFNVATSVQPQGYFSNGTMPKSSSFWCGLR